MLVLTRKSEEKIIIGTNNKIVITILKIQGDKVSIGIEADREIFPIFRDELLKNSERGAIDAPNKNNEFISSPTNFQIDLKNEVNEESNTSI
jgi:carbon storage regulator CsrA